ncbi:MAG: hypothetical protein Q7J34_11070 [Bacteroidales bacterium]|nr:hypothetical protein [Bacteroidales bacterium]
MKQFSVRTLFTFMFALGFVAIYAQNATKTKIPSVFSQSLEKNMAQLGEPYLSWFNNKSDRLPRNFSEQIANLQWPLESISEKGELLSTKEKYYKTVYKALRKLKVAGIDPIWSVIANNPINSMCGEGDFESGNLDLTEWSGSYGNLTSSLNDPSVGTYLSGFLPLSGINHPLNSSVIHHSIISAGNDPTLGALLQTTVTSSSNFSFRIGNSWNGKGVDLISKKFIVSGNGIIRFSYALVLQGPHGATDNPSFWVKVFDDLGNPISNVVYLDPISSLPMEHIVSDASNPFFMTLGGINYRDWTCAKIDLRGVL